MRWLFVLSGALILQILSLTIANHSFCDESPAHPIVLVVGTRPEAIKMIPVYQALKARGLPICLCATGQHIELVSDVFSLFGVRPDVELKVMRPGQDLYYLTQTLLTKMKELYKEIKPSLVVVQGDTTSAMVSVLVAFYEKIPVAHIEAGLRTGNMYAPFPEECNRRIITLISSWHFAPTPLAVSRLRAEGVREDSIFYTGNTVVDALYDVLERMNRKDILPSPHLVEALDNQRMLGRKIVLLTAHRRESFDGGLVRIFHAIKRVLLLHSDICVVFPVHPNPVIRNALDEVGLDSLPNIVLTPPLAYHDLVYVMDKASGIATDSGGISEEAVSLHKPMCILRHETDRPEALEGGSALIVGTDEDKIVSGIEWMVERCPIDGSKRGSPFGDGTSSQRIADVLEQAFLKRVE